MNCHLTEAGNPNKLTDEEFGKIITEFLIPDLNKYRQDIKKDDLPILLTADGEGNRFDVTALTALQQNNIILIKSPAHTTSVLQALDVVFFALLEKDHKYKGKTPLGSEETLTALAARLMKSVNSFYKVSDDAITSSFRTARLVPFQPMNDAEIKTQWPQGKVASKRRSYQRGLVVLTSAKSIEIVQAQKRKKKKSNKRKKVTTSEASSSSPTVNENINTNAVESPPKKKQKVEVPKHVGGSGPHYTRSKPAIPNQA